MLYNSKKRPASDVEVSGDGPSQPKIPKAKGVETASHGLDFQVQLLMFFAYQGYLISQKDENYLFEIGKEREEAGKFDDIVFRYKKDENQKEWNNLFLQAKHTLHMEESKKIPVAKLLSPNCKDPFNLLKYFSSYCQSKKNPVEGEVIESCVIVTNNDFRFEKNKPLKLQPCYRLDKTKNKVKGKAKTKVGDNLYLKELERKNINPILDTSEFKTAKFYKIDQGEDRVKELMKEFKKLFDSIKNAGKQEGHQDDEQGPEPQQKEQEQEEQKGQQDLEKQQKQQEQQDEQQEHELDLEQQGQQEQQNEQQEHELDLEQQENEQDLEQQHKQQEQEDEQDLKQQLPEQDEEEQRRKSTDQEVLHNLKDVMIDDELLEEKIRGFLDTLLFVVSLPDRKELREITKDKIGEEFYLLDDSIISQFNCWMFDYTIDIQKNKNDFMTKNEIEIYFREMKKTINRLKHLPSYYIDLEKSKIDFTNKSIIDDFLKGEDKILKIRTESMFLTAVKINCVLKDHPLKRRYGYKGKYSFVNLEELLLDDIAIQREIEFFERESNLLVIVFDAEDRNKALESLLSPVCNIASESSAKKVLLITELNSDVPLPSSVREQVKEAIDKANNFRDLTEKSKTKVLDKPIPFQEGAEVPIKRLYFKLPTNKQQPSPEQLQKFDIDAKSLECLEKDCIKIGKPFSVSDLEGAYTKLYEKIDVNTLLEKLQEPIDNFIISGINEAKKKDAFIEKLKDASGKQVISFKESQLCERKFERGKVHKITRRIMLTGAEFAEQDFRKLCHDNPNKSVIYWIIWKDNKFILNSLYFPKIFLERRFKCPEQSVAYGDLETELDEPNSAFFITGVESLEELHLEESVRTKLEEKGDFGNVLFHTTDRNKRSAFNNFTETIRQRNDNKYVCWLEFENYGIGQFVWKDVTRRKIWEDELIGLIKNKSSVIIDKPGMGKSTTLTLLSEKMLQSHWVILITLRDWEETIDCLPDNYDEINAGVVIKFIFGTNNSVSGFEKHLAKYVLYNADGNKPLLLLFDGFDEIKSYDSENINKMKVEKLLKYLKEETEATVWVTAREHDVTTLKNTLSVFDIKFDEVNEDEQRKYFCNTWKSSLALRAKTDKIRDIFDSEDCKFQKYYNELSSTAKAILENQSNDFMGIPLTLRLFAEAFRSKFEKFIKDEEENCEDDFNNLSVLNLYQYFIDEKFNIYLREKTTLASSLTAESESWFKYLPMKFHFRLAFRELYGDEGTMNIVGVKSPLMLEGDRVNIERGKISELLKLGIIRSTKENHYEFLHGTLAEYFVSLMFIQLLRSKSQSNQPKYNKVLTFLKRNVLKMKNEVIFKFLDAKSKEDSALNEVWNLILSGASEKNLLGEASLRHTFHITKLQTGCMNEDIQYLRARVDECVQTDKNGDYLSYHNHRRGSGTWPLQKLITKCTQEISSDHLKSNLPLLLQIFNKDPNLCEMLTKERVSLIIDRYIYLTGIVQGDLDIEFVKKCLTGINMISDIGRPTPIFQIPHPLNYYRPRTVITDWLETEGVKFVKETMCLTPEIAAEFTQYCQGDSGLGYFVLRVFNNLIPKLLSLKYLSKFDPALFSKIDTFSLVQMFVAFTGVIRVFRLDLSEGSLEGLLQCIRQLLHPDAVSGERLTVCIKSLIALKGWNFCLTFENSALALHHKSENGEYSCLLNLQHEDKIVNLIKLKQIDADNWEQECKVVANCMAKHLGESQ